MNKLHTPCAKAKGFIFLCISAVCQPFGVDCRFFASLSTACIQGAIFSKCSEARHYTVRLPKDFTDSCICTYLTGACYIANSRASRTQACIRSNEVKRAFYDILVSFHASSPSVLVERVYPEQASTAKCNTSPANAPNTIRASSIVTGA